MLHLGGDSLPIAARQDNSRALRASGQFPSSVSKVQKMLAKVTTQWRVSSGARSSKKRGSKRGGRLPSRGLAARLAAPPAASSGKIQYDSLKRDEMSKLVQEIHQMVRQLHQETDDRQKFSSNSQGLFSPKAAAASSFLNKRGLEPEYHDPVEEKIDEILAMIR